MSNAMKKGAMLITVAGRSGAPGGPPAGSGGQGQGNAVMAEVVRLVHAVSARKK